MVKIFVYSNGYVTRLTDRLKECHEAEPDKFKVYEVSMEDYLLYQLGTHICVDGKPQAVAVQSREDKVKEERKRAYDKQRQELANAFNSALLDGDEELMNEIREDLQALKDSYVEGVAEDVQDESEM